MSGHDHGAATGDRRVLWAVGANVLLTVAQVVGGILSGSLSLIADALHNFSDAASLVIAFVARRISRRPSNEAMTFGYVRAEIVAALINYTTLIIIGLYLVYEAVMRFIEPQPVEGWMIVIIAAVALVVDVATAWLTYALSKGSMNIRAAFLHNIADALGSVGVIVAGTLILLYDWRIVDPIVTLLIAGYILWQAFSEIGGAVRLLMLGAPPDIDVGSVLEAMRRTEGVEDVHHLHVWAIDESRIALEAHIVAAEGLPLEACASIRRRLRERLRSRFGISHVTLEVESPSEREADDERQVIGHPTGGATGHDNHASHSFGKGE